MDTSEIMNKIEEQGNPRHPVSQPYLESLSQEHAAILQTIALVINLNEPTFSLFTNTIRSVKEAVKGAPLGIALFAMLFVSDLLAIGIENEGPDVRRLLGADPKEN